MKMDYFKTDISKKEFKTLTKDILAVMSKSGLCGKCSCKQHKDFFLTCSQCRDVRCSNCGILKFSISLLIKLADDDGRNYLQNFITFNIEKSNETKKRIKTFDIKVYHKSKKNRSQVVMKTLEDCNKIQYISKRRKRHFYKKN